MYLLCFVCDILSLLERGVLKTCNESCRDFEGVTQGYKFKTDIRIIPLQRCDVVLGIQWLKTLGDCVFNFGQVTISFVKEGKRISLKGTRDGYGSSISMISARDSGFAGGYGKEQVSLTAYLFQVTQQNEEAQLPAPILNVLREFEVVFQEQKPLPPHRKYDHHIPLKTGSDPFTIRPYRYPQVQKFEIDKIVQEMLVSSIIQPS